VQVVEESVAVLLPPEVVALNETVPVGLIPLTLAVQAQLPLDSDLGGVW
jgi:hypothetical protein